MGHLVSSGFCRHGFGPDQGCAGGRMVAPFRPASRRPSIDEPLTWGTEEKSREDSAYGYRPGRGGADAIKEVHRLVCRGYTDVVDADLSAYFDTIPHRELMQSVARRIVDRHGLRLIKLWLKAPIEGRAG